MIFLLVFAGLIYFTKKRVWADAHYFLLPLAGEGSGMRAFAKAAAGSAA